jgi:hypothetical protein
MIEGIELGYAWPGASLWALCWRCSLSLKTSALLVGTLCLLSPGTAGANNDHEIFPAQLKQLLPITSMVVMAVPYGVAFAARLNEKNLPNNSCVYRIDTVSGAASNQVVSALDESLLEYKLGAQKKIELRLGIILNTENAAPREFYFEDSGRGKNVHGFSDNHRILASEVLPSRLRSLLVHPEAKLIKDLHDLCRHF